MIAAFGAWTVGQVAAWRVGWKMFVPEYQYQLLPRQALETNLLESLFFLHSQPPVMNFLWGAAMKLEQLLPMFSATRSLFALNLGLSAIALWAFVDLMERLRVRSWVSWLGTLWFVTNPAIYFFGSVHFYPLHEHTWLLIAANLIHRFISNGQRIYFIGLLVCLAALTYTRSLFHPLFAATIALGAVAFLSRSFDAGGTPTTLETNPRSSLTAWRLSAWPLVVFVFVLAAWPIKNLLVFDFLGMSSWQGLNLAHGLDVDRSPYARMFAFGDGPEAQREREAAAGDLPTRYAKQPALALTVKSLGIPNWNHWSMIAYSDRLQTRALDRVRSEPSLMLKKALNNYAMLSRGTTRSPMTDELPPRGSSSWGPTWRRLHEGPLFVPRMAWGGTPMSPFGLVLPILCMVLLYRTLAAGRIEDRAVFVMGLFTMLWVAALTLLVDGAEANRMRFGVDALFVIASLAALSLSTEESS